MSTRRQGFLDWAKTKGPDVLAHSSVSEPQIAEAVKHVLGSQHLQQLLQEDNQWGHPRLLAALARYHHLTTEQPNILIVPGASTAIFLVCQAFLTADDEVIVETPNYEPLVDCIQSQQAQAVPWQRQPENFALDLNKLEGLITKKTRLIMLTNLHNPSGTLTTRPELLQLAEIARKAGHPQLKIVVDEIYWGLVKDPSHRSVIDLSEQFIALNSLSKVYGMGMLRCGWIAASPETIGQLRETYKQVVNIGSLITESIAASVFEQIEDYRQSAQTLVAANRGVLQAALGDLRERGIITGAIPEDGCVFFPQLPWLETLGTGKANDVIATLDQEFGTAPGAFFGNPYAAHIRIGFGGPKDEVSTALEHLRGRLEQLYQQATR